MRTTPMELQELREFVNKVIKEHKVLKKILFILSVLLFSIGAEAQSISYIETVGQWYNVYDEHGKKIKAVSSSQGELMGYGSSFYIIKQGSSFYVTYTPNGKQIHTFSISSIGKFVSASGDTFTSKLGTWIYTWSKDGKKISVRSGK